MAFTRPKGFLGLTFIGLAYLLLELAFNARLLEISSSIPSHSTLTAVERAGRTISGIGAGLLLWRYLGARLSTGFTVGQLVLALALSIPTVWWAQERLVDAMVEASAPDTLRRATIAVAYSVSLKDGKAALKGLEWVPKDKSSADARTFLVVFPALLVQNAELGPKVEKQFSEIVRARIECEFGTSSQFFNRHYVGKIEGPTKNFYNGTYADGSKKAEQSALRWGRDRVQKEFDKEAAKHGIHGSLPYGMEWTEFSQHPSVLDKMRRELPRAITEYVSPTAVRFNMSEPQVTKDIYNPVVAGARHKVQGGLLADASEFNSKGPRYAEGTRAMKAVVVPPVALGFSLFFGLLNLVSLVASVAPGRWSWLVWGIGVVALGLVSTRIENRITASEPFQFLVNDAAKQGPMLAETLRWTVRMEPWLNGFTRGLGPLIAIDNPQPVVSSCASLS